MMKKNEQWAESFECSFYISYRSLSTDYAYACILAELRAWIIVTSTVECLFSPGPAPPVLIFNLCTCVLWPLTGIGSFRTKQRMLQWHSLSIISCIDVSMGVLCELTALISLHQSVLARPSDPWCVESVLWPLVQVWHSASSHQHSARRQKIFLISSESNKSSLNP